MLLANGWQPSKVDNCGDSEAAEDRKGRHPDRGVDDGRSHCRGNDSEDESEQGGVVRGHQSRGDEPKDSVAAGPDHSGEGLVGHWGRLP